MALPLLSAAALVEVMPLPSQSLLTPKPAMIWPRTEVTAAASVVASPAA